MMNTCRTRRLVAALATAVTAFGVAAAPVAGAATQDAGSGAAVAAPAPVPMRVAIVVVDSVDPGYDMALWDNLLRRPFADGQSYRDGLERIAGGAVTVTTDLFGAFQAGMGDECRVDRWRKAATDGMVARGIDPDKYDHIVAFASARRPCGFVSVGEPGGKGVFLNDTFDMRALVMAIGTNRGLRLSGTSHCGPKPSFDCRVKLYDPLDVMWQNPYTSTLPLMYPWPGYLNVAHKRALGWLPDAMVERPAAGTHTFSVTSNNRLLSEGGTRMLEVPRGDGSTITVERGTGKHDRGVYVRLACPSDNVCPNAKGYDTVLVFMNYGQGFPSLDVGQTFTDDISGVSVTLREDDPTRPAARVEVTVPPANTVRASSRAGLVRVQGTDGNDTVRVTTVKGERIVDANGAAMAAGPGCRLDGTTVRCKGGQIAMALGAGNDRVTVVGRFRATFDGGAGDDTFVASRAADVFVGGAGIDTVDYRGRNTDKKMGGPVVVKIGGGSVSGQKGERDDIRADVERVLVP